VARLTLAIRQPRGLAARSSDDDRAPHDVLRCEDGVCRLSAAAR
jgi:hypothetical protein